MLRLGLWSDSHGVEHLQSIKKVLDLEGIAQENRVFLGDEQGDVLTSSTSHFSRLASLKRRQLLKNTSARDGVLAGNYTDEQLQLNVVDSYNVGLEVANNIATEVSKDSLEIFGPVKRLTGNHDRLVMKDVYGEGLIEEVDLFDFNGMRVLAYSGAGDAAMKNSFFDSGTYANDGENDDYKFRKWTQPIINAISKGVVTNLMGHVPPFTKADESNIDQTEKHLEGVVEEAWSQRKANPNLTDEQKDEALTFFWGHKHRGAKAEFIEYDTGAKLLSVTPGVSSLQDNFGAYATFAVAEFDESNQKLDALQEFRIYTFHNERVVEHHATHKVDWAKEEVNITKHEDVVLKEKIPEIRDYLALDNNHTELGPCLNLSYDGLGPRAMDQLLIKKLHSVFDYASESSDMARRIVNNARRNLSLGKESGTMVTEPEIATETTFIYHSLSEEAAKVFGISLDNLTEDGDLFRDILINAAYGLTASDFYGSIRWKDFKVDDIKGFGEGLIGKVSESISSKYQSVALEGIGGDDFQEMAELYMPLNVERTRSLAKYERQEGIDLFIKTWKKGLLSAEDVVPTDLYKVTTDYTANEKTKVELRSLLGVTELSDGELTEEQLQSQQQMEQQRAVQGLGQALQNAQNSGVDLDQLFNRQYSPQANTGPQGYEHQIDSTTPLPANMLPEAPTTPTFVPGPSL